MELSFDQGSRIAVLGTSGQVGSACLRWLGPMAVGLSRAEADLANVDGVLARLTAVQPTAVVNAAAYTQVERSEDEEPLAEVINGAAPGRLAAWCAEHDVPLVHYSTDYVFSGQTDRPWCEDDAVAPLNAYGRTKLAGERALAAAGGRHLIFRTSWVYDEAGRNFFTTMARLGREKETLRVVSDQIGAPTYAPDLARASLAALSAALHQPVFPTGVYHLCHGGETSWYGFAEAIFARLPGVKVRSLVPISTQEYGGKVIRPLNSRLDTRRIAQVLNIRLPDWQDGLASCFEVYASCR